MLRLLRVLALTHLIAMLLPLALFISVFGLLVTEPPIEIGPVLFTCNVQPFPDGSSLYVCGLTTR